MHGVCGVHVDSMRLCMHLRGTKPAAALPAAEYAGALAACICACGCMRLSFNLRGITRTLPACTAVLGVIVLPEAALQAAA